jgi:hypothetical protein
VFASGDVIEEHDLSVFFGLNLDSLGAVARLRLGRVHINDLSVSLVAEEETGVGVRVHSEVRRVTHRTVVRLPVVVGEVRRFGYQHFLTLEVEAEVLSLQTVSQVYITADLILAILFVTDENDSRHAAITNQFLALCQCRQESTVINLAASMRKGLRLI